MKLPADVQLDRWKSRFSGDTYFYGMEPGPVARRAVRYHQASTGYGVTGGGAIHNMTALDAGCGEGQDLAFLAECGYHATGFDFTEEGVAKARRIMAARGLHAETTVADLRSWQPERRYNLVICVNALQFLGEEAPAALAQVASSVAPGGVLGLSLFAPEERETDVRDGILFITLPDLMTALNPNPLNAGWQMLETAQLWQWNEKTNTPQPFVTLIARRKNDSDR